ncbi:MAG: T9SS type A sorting domain-containing protein, partial [Bacteroidota bacterium]
RLGETDFIPYQVVADTFLLLRKTNLSQSYFAVQTLSQNNEPGLRSFGFDYRNLAGSCYIEEWYAEGLEDEGVRLYLSLGTDLGLQKIYIERELDGQYFPIDSLLPSPRLQSLDALPQQGLNRYRARLIRQDGSEIFSQPSIAYSLQEPSFLVFPNPISRSEQLGIYSQISEEEGWIEMYNLAGQLVLRTKLLAERDAVNIAYLPPGLYHYHLYRESRHLSGKLRILP